MLVWLSEVAGANPAVAGFKAARLAAAMAAGFRVPTGFVVPVGQPDPDDDELIEAASRVGPSLAVRSSGVAEDLVGASFAGLYESYLDVPPEGVPAAVRRCRSAAGSDQVAAYRPKDSVPGMAVLVQAMVAADAAGVAFTADPVSGDRTEVVVTAVRGVADDLVTGDAAGEEWRVEGGNSTPRGAGAVLTAVQAASVADTARRLELLFGRPQDVEWAVTGDQVHVLQARPMTALPEPAAWTPPGPGLWACNFRLGEWLPDPITPLFASWLLPVFDRGFRAAMRDTADAAVPFPYGLINGWYYATPNPAIRRIPGAVVRSRGRLLKFMIRTVVLPGRRPLRADQALDRLYRDWHDRLLPHQQQLAAVQPDHLGFAELTALVEQIIETAGRHFWYLAVVGGAAWKIEGAVQTFLDRHGLGDVDAAVLLSVLVPPAGASAHAVHSLDWFHPTTGEYQSLTDTPGTDTVHSPAEEARRALERRSLDHLAGDPRARDEWTKMLTVAQKYVRIREEQSASLTLAWPLLRQCAARIAEICTAAGIVDDPALAFFLTHDELRQQCPASPEAAVRRESWLVQRRLSPPLTVGRPPALIGRRLIAAVGGDRASRSTVDQLLGQPVSPGRATGPVRIVHDPAGFADVRPGDVIVAPATTPAWTSLFGRAAAIITDRGSAAAHSAILAREYGIPGVAATGNATTRLRDGILVTVDGSRGIVKILKAQP